MPTRFGDIGLLVFPKHLTFLRFCFFIVFIHKKELFNFYRVNVTRNRKNLLAKLDVIFYNGFYQEKEKKKGKNIYKQSVGSIFKP